MLDADDPAAYLYPRKAHRYYAKGVGMIGKTFFYTVSTNTYETVLSHYHVASRE